MRISDWSSDVCSSDLVRRITMAERAAGVTKNEQLPWRRRDHALFVAFAPVHKPRYACAVVVEHGGGGSTVAAPTARAILLETQHRDPSGRRPLPIVTTSQIADRAGCPSTASVPPATPTSAAPK